jgi:hypothetical protein
VVLKIACSQSHCKIQAPFSATPCEQFKVLSALVLYLVRKDAMRVSFYLHRIEVSWRCPGEWHQALCLRLSHNIRFPLRFGRDRLTSASQGSQDRDIPESREPGGQPRTSSSPAAPSTQRQPSGTGPTPCLLLLYAVVSGAVCCLCMLYVMRCV